MTALLALLGALQLGVMSPGPSFVLVARTAIARSRAHGVAAALGMGLGGMIFALLALFGLTALLHQLPVLYTVLQIAGGAYLIYLSYLLWRHAPTPLEVTGAVTGEPGTSLLRAFLVALGTQVSNPKTIVVYGSVFAALLPAPLPSWMFWVLPPLVFAIEAFWYALVALVFSLARPRAAYLHFKSWIDRAAGTVLGLLGLRLILEAARRQ